MNLNSRMGPWLFRYLISLALPYIGDFISGYEIDEIIKEIMDSI